MSAFRRFETSACLVVIGTLFIAPIWTQIQ
jgi:hypothetical protein